MTTNLSSVKDFIGFTNVHISPNPSFVHRQCCGRQSGLAAGSGTETKSHRRAEARRGSGGGRPGAGGEVFQDLPSVGPPPAGSRPLRSISLQPGGFQARCERVGQKGGLICDYCYSYCSVLLILLIFSFLQCFVN